MEACIVQNILKQYVCKYLALGGEPEIEAEKLVMFKFVFLNITKLCSDVSFCNIQMSLF